MRVTPSREMIEYIGSIGATSKCRTTGGPLTPAPKRSGAGPRDDLAGAVGVFDKLQSMSVWMYALLLTVLSALVVALVLIVRGLIVVGLVVGPLAFYNATVAQDREEATNIVAPNAASRRLVPSGSSPEVEERDAGSSITNGGEIPHPTTESRPHGILKRQQRTPLPPSIAELNGHIVDDIVERADVDETDVESVEVDRQTPEVVFPNSIDPTVVFPKEIEGQTDGDAAANATVDETDSKRVEVAPDSNLERPAAPVSRLPAVTAKPRHNQQANRYSQPSAERHRVSSRNGNWYGVASIVIGLVTIYCLLAGRRNDEARRDREANRVAGGRRSYPLQPRVNGQNGARTELKASGAPCSQSRSDNDPHAQANENSPPWAIGTRAPRPFPPVIPTTCGKTPSHPSNSLSPRDSAIL